MNSRSHYHRHRYPIDIISQCVWLYIRSSLSYRDVELIMAERGISVSYESVRAWCRKFGKEYARRLRRRGGPVGDTWHLDEVYFKGANNRAENSHKPTRERERRRCRFRSASEAQRFLSTFSAISNQFRQGRHLVAASNYRILMTRRFAEWRAICASAV